jgi:hypothetical protein
MAFAADIVLRDNAAADKTFSSRNTDGSRVERIDQASTAMEPRILVIDHRRAGKSGTPEYRDEHLVQFKVTKKDAVTGKLYTGFANLTIGVPVDGIVVRAEYDHIISFLKSATNGFLTTTANIDKLLRSES